MMLQRGAPLAWLQRQMGHTTLQMLIRHYWRYMQVHDLDPDDMIRLESELRSSNNLGVPHS